MKYTTKIVALLLASPVLLAGGVCRAQSDSNVYNERVIVTSRYRPVIDENPKVNVAPAITDTVATMPKSFTYDISSRRLTSLYVPSRIKAARIIGEPATRLYNNYLKLGFGNYWSPLAEVYFNSLRDKDKTYGIRATHHSSWGTIGHASDSLPSATHYGQAPFSFTEVALFGKMITKHRLQLSADLSYQNDFTRYYGFSDSTLYSVMNCTRDDISLSDYNAAYNLVGLNLGLKTLNTDVHALGYEANLGLWDMFASYSQNQFEVGFDGNIHYGFSIAQKYKGIAYLHLSYNGFAEQFNPTALPLGADSLMGVALLDRDDSTGISSLGSRHYLNLYKANPYLDFLFQGFQVHAGAVVALDAYNFPNGGKVHVYPDAVVGKTLLKDMLNVSLGAQGNIDANSWNTIRLVNPYVAPDADQRATSHYDFFAKARFSFSKKMDLNLYGMYSLLNDDLSFMLNDRYELQNVFTPVYDSLTRIKVGGSFLFVNDEMLQLEAKGNYYIYRNLRTVNVGGKSEALPLYYRPSFDAGLSATVNYHDKIIGRVEFQLLGPTPYDTQVAADGSDSTLYLPMRYGLNMEVEYRYNKALSFFLKADNLLFQRYFYWQNYPSYRGLFLVGLTYTIPN